MKKITTVILAGLMATACNKMESGKPESSAPAESASAVENLNIQAENFEEIDSTGVLMLPLYMGQNRNSDGGKSYKETSENENWNILFLDTKTNAQHLLTDKKILISRTDYKYGGGGTLPYKSDFIFYNAKTDDFDGDKVLTQDDPTYLFVSDKAGNNFRQISPKGRNVAAWTILKDNKVVMTAYKDSNSNKKFDPQDEASIFEVALNKDETPREVITPDTKSLIKKLYARDWKKVK